MRGVSTEQADAHLDVLKDVFALTISKDHLHGELAKSRADMYRMMLLQAGIVIGANAGLTALIVTTL